jgi:hypothetical protein
VNVPVAMPENGARAQKPARNRKRHIICQFQDAFLSGASCGGRLIIKVQIVVLFVI